MPTPESRTVAGAGVERLYQDYQRPILAHLMRLVHDRETAEDLCQETFFKALRSWDSRDTQASAAAWLYRIATNTAYDYLRRGRKIRFSPLIDSDHPAIFDSESQIDEQEPVQKALDLLPPAYRLPLMMHSCEGRSTQEIADALGVSNSAVKTRLFRARERFREVYQG